MKREIKFRVWNKETKDMIYNIRLGIWKGSDEGMMQFTGLKDSKGKEIYEGDILTNNWIVNWGEIEGLEQLFIRDIAPNCIGLIVPMDYKKREVIGNIYENPELLNQ
ncbi:MAG: YopX family protein [Nanoarchaeota archaeon]